MVLACSLGLPLPLVLLHAFSPPSHTLCVLPPINLWHTRRAILRHGGMGDKFCATFNTRLCFVINHCFLPFQKCYLFIHINVTSHRVKRLVLQGFLECNFFQQHELGHQLVAVPSDSSSFGSNPNRFRYERTYGSFSARSLIPTLPTQCSCFHRFHQSPPRYLGLVTSQ